MSARLFVAIELPTPVCEALVEWRPAHPVLRPVSPQALHVTVAFLGERDEEEVAAIGALLDPLARPVSDLALADTHWLPRGRPHALAVEVADGEGALAGLQADVARVLAEEAGFVPEPRPFLAHVTVARMRPDARIPGPLLDLRRPPAIPFDGECLTLFRSVLGPHGARYEPLRRVRLA